MKAKPVMKKGIEYYEVDSKDCSNCSNASAEYRKICPVCKGTGLVKIPLRKDKHVYDYVASGFIDGTNESGFTGLPGGYRYYDGLYYGFGNFGNWWSSTEHITNTAWSRNLGSSSGDANRNSSLKRNGFSVRCLRD